MPPVTPAIHENSRTASGQFGIDQPLGHTVAIVSHVLADRLGIGLADDATLDRFDDAARALVRPRRGPGAVVRDSSPKFGSLLSAVPPGEGTCRRRASHWEPAYWSALGWGLRTGRGKTE